MWNFVLTPKVVLLLVACGLICITPGSATFQIIVQGGTVISADVPETGIVATIGGGGNVAKVSLTSLPITAVLD